ncbi:phospholipid-binding protein MlaC [Mycoavidus sp. B2-EB]|uniref:MlaC/ttg2D family ABC transporter substrate-binding protein n=1 Tax=Mycoavidus sp. B2-EB TaxID=2651972 RepID=UPI0016291B71|nr:ABC transporter substrate-binding protein [Mycoavidus sp. B2-EB]BBO59178.1 hypothetical protein MPB2EB_0283 [Mycoavidus sp. B2-EB]
MKERSLRPIFSLAYAVLCLFCGSAMAQIVAASAGTPDGLVKTITSEVLDTIKQDPDLRKGDISKISQLVDEKILPHADIERTTRLVMGRHWRTATTDQQAELVKQFKDLLFYTYSGAVAQIRDQTVEYLPFRMKADATDVVVRTKVNNQGQVIQLDYRLEKKGNDWKVYDLNVGGAWLVQTYQQQFSELITQRGVNGLLEFLKQRNLKLGGKQ